jgi:TatD DNase family protein
VWTDSHCHLDYEGVPTDAVERARAAGVTRIVTVGTDVEHSAQAAAVAAEHDNVWATVGVHPHDAVGGIVGIAELLDAPRVVAVGECGLDYHYDHSPRDAQRAAFAAQIAMARDRGLALVVHTREAWDDTLSILTAEGMPDRTVIHCFTGGPHEARRALDVGAWVSFSGIVTFKNADDVREAARLCPLDRMLVETDAPFLAPVPHRGKPNEPAYVAVVGEAVAAVKGVAPEDVAEASSQNASTVFGI